MILPGRPCGDKNITIMVCGRAKYRNNIERHRYGYAQEEVKRENYGWIDEEKRNGTSDYEEKNRRNVTCGDKKRRPKKKYMKTLCRSFSRTTGEFLGKGAEGRVGESRGSLKGSVRCERGKTEVVTEATGSVKQDGRKTSDDAGKKEKDDNGRRGSGGFATIQSVSEARRSGDRREERGGWR